MAELWRETWDLAERFLACFTYKPGWSFSLERRGHPDSPFLRDWVDITLVIVADVEDAYHPGKRTKFGSRYSIVPEAIMLAVAPEQVFMDMMHRWIWDMEKHEMDEWFRLDGVAPFDPHGPKPLPVVPLPEGLKKKQSA